MKEFTRDLERRILSFCFHVALCPRKPTSCCLCVEGIQEELHGSALCLISMCTMDSVGFWWHSAWAAVVVQVQMRKHKCLMSKHAHTNSNQHSNTNKRTERNEIENGNGIRKIPSTRPEAPSGTKHASSNLSAKSLENLLSLERVFPLKNPCENSRSGNTISLFKQNFSRKSLTKEGIQDFRWKFYQKFRQIFWKLLFLKRFQLQQQKIQKVSEIRKKKPFSKEIRFSKSLKLQPETKN